MTICGRLVGIVFHNKIIDKENDENVKKWILMAFKEAIHSRNSCILLHGINEYSYMIR